MKKTILIIDDEKDQVDNLSRYLGSHLPSEYHIITAHEEADIIDKIDNAYYSLVILDLRMDEYEIDGVKIANKIVETNSFAKILITSAFTAEFYQSLKTLLLSGKIIDTIDKTSFTEFAEQVKNSIEIYHNELFASDDSIQNALLESYSDCKNTENTYQKGVKFENFVSLLFNNIGFDKIIKRTIDKSRNEVDLIVRNDIDDKFLEKFGKYFLIECKNMPVTNIGKNTFIIFKSISTALSAAITSSSKKT